MLARPRLIARFLLPLCIGLIATTSVAAETLRVEVRDGQTGELLEDAFVMVGTAEGVPFVGNVAWTGADGTAVFDHPSLAFPQTVTAGAEGQALTTVCEAVTGEVGLALYPAEPDTTMGGLRTIVQGDVTEMETVNNDNHFDAAVILPALDASSFALSDKMPFVILPDTTDFPVIGPVPMLSNIYMPPQIEFVFFTFEKTPYRIDVPGDQQQTFVAIHARVSIDDLLGGTFLETAEIREVGVERDVDLDAPGPEIVDIVCDLPLVPELTVTLDDYPEEAQIQAASAALIPAGDRELVVGFDTRGTVPLRSEVFELATLEPQGDLSDATNIAIGTYIDSSAAREYTAGIFDLSGFTPPHEVCFEDWMLIPEIEQRAHLFLWEDPTNPGQSPSPTWTRSNLGLRPIDPQDSTVVKSVDWRIYAPAEPGRFVLPELPESAPGPPSGLPDPLETPEEDQLYWEFVAANPPGELSDVLRDFMQGGTHWSSRWVPIDLSPTSAPGGRRPAPRLALHAAPNPACGEVRFDWVGGAVGRADLELIGPQGRRVWTRAVRLAAGRQVWTGDASGGAPAEAGVYWVQLRRDGRMLGRQRFLWLR
ncbi:MAG: hypothetical protein GF330_01335 [Candidatus Eisenbacteria bacterium]|nr:hypothetical protein [Candidatus Eisenbacteria bacterium]